MALEVKGRGCIPQEAKLLQHLVFPTPLEECRRWVQSCSLLPPGAFGGNEGQQDAKRHIPLSR